LFSLYDTTWLNVIIAKAFTYEFFLVDFVNIKIGWMFVEHNGVLVIDENSKESPMNIMLI
jgi:hypothetical protein